MNSRYRKGQAVWARWGKGWRQATVEVAKHNLVVVNWPNGHNSPRDRSFVAPRDPGLKGFDKPKEGVTEPVEATVKAVVYVTEGGMLEVFWGNLEPAGYEFRAKTLDGGRTWLGESSWCTWEKLPEDLSIDGIEGLDSLRRALSEAQNLRELRRNSSVKVNSAHCKDPRASKATTPGQERV